MFGKRDESSDRIQATSKRWNVGSLVTAHPAIAALPAVSSASRNSSTSRGRSASHNSSASRSSILPYFKKHWLPRLLELFTEYRTPKYHILAQCLALEVGGEWAHCRSCRTVQRPFPGDSRCVVCCRTGTVKQIDPDSDSVFTARKGYYRASSIQALAPEAEREPPVAIIAAEHTAQLNEAQVDEVFSRAEQHELLFQDMDIALPKPGEQPPTAIDVLSSTTTMEVGIDIGSLCGVALRNMPPARSSYQQRAGRAGRRGNAVATVIAFGSADSHDEQYFREPEAMIRGPVEDPTLTLDNAAIARRHVTAFLFQRYHEKRLPDVKPHEQRQLFEVLGTVKGFLDDSSRLNRRDFESWMRRNEDELRSSVDNWLPEDLQQQERKYLLSQLVDETLRVVDKALASNISEVDNGGAIGVSRDHPAEAADESSGYRAEAAGTSSDYHTEAADGSSEAKEYLDAREADVPADESMAEVLSETDDEPMVEVPPETDGEPSTAVRSATNLLDRLLYKGVLPRYAFPTDVVSFHVFDRNRSSWFRPAFQYAPSQGLPVALTQYAPGKEIWIDGKLWTSGALYSPMQADRFQAWQQRRWYFECNVCRYAKTYGYEEARRDEKRDCPACGSLDEFGGAKTWIRPPGFAHPQNEEEGTSPEDQPEKSYATRAKLVADSPSDSERWQQTTSRIRQYFHRTHLLVTNSGPRRKGYVYCTRCGLIGPATHKRNRYSEAHPKPYPDEREQTCSGSVATTGLVLGTDFISDVLLIGIKVQPPVTLKPGYLATDIALRTLAEAITIAGARILEIEKTELQAEYRPALTPGGRTGMESEIYIYDTLPGGAGFTQQIGERGRRIFDEALKLLERCPSDCDYSCYRCLRSFKNRFEHDQLDRHVGASLLRYLLDGVEPSLSKTRIESSTNRLFADLSQRNIEEIEFIRQAKVQMPVIGTVQVPILARYGIGELPIGLHGPLTPNFITDKNLRKIKDLDINDVCLIDEIMVTRNLPSASRKVLSMLGV